MTIIGSKDYINSLKKESKSIYVKTNKYPILRRIWLSNFIVDDNVNFQIKTSKYIKEKLKKESEEIHWEYDKIKGLKIIPIEIMHLYNI